MTTVDFMKINSFESQIFQQGSQFEKRVLLVANANTTSPQKLLDKAIADLQASGPHGRTHQQFSASSVTDDIMKIAQGNALVFLNDSAQLLTTFGIDCPDKISFSAQASDLIRKTIKRINEINRSLPDSIQYRKSIESLVSDAPKLGKFLQGVYDYQLCIALGSVANFQSGTDFSEASANIKKWISSAKAQQVEAIFLEGSSLFCLPKEVCQLTGLKTLELSDNHIKSLPDEIGTLTALTRLSLDRNELKAIPSSLGRLKNLVCLHLAENRLKSIPPSIGNLSVLEQLDLSSNKIKELPEEIGDLSALAELDLTGNDEIDTLPRKMVNLKGLTYLGLSPTTFEERPIVYDDGHITFNQKLLGDIIKRSKLQKIVPDLRLQKILWGSCEETAEKRQIVANLFSSGNGDDSTRVAQILKSSSIEKKTCKKLLAKIEEYASMHKETRGLDQGQIDTIVGLCESKSTSPDSSSSYTPPETATGTSIVDPMELTPLV